MTLYSWRIVKKKRRSDAFTGEGARRYGGRWNSRGVPVVYTAESASLAVLELLAHLESDSLMQEYLLYQLGFEETLVESILEGTLSHDWRSYPAPVALRGIGDQWVAEARSVILSVPSAIVPAERVFLLNPEHVDFQEIEIGEPEPFGFDPRLTKA